MRKVADAIIAMRGWRRIVLAVAAGAVSALAQAPWFAFPVLWITVPSLLWMIDGATAPVGVGRLGRLVPAAIVGWCFGFGYFLAGMWWIGAAFLVDPEKFAWLMPIAVVALPAGLAVFWGFGAALARLFWTGSWPRIVIFAAAFSFAEWLRGHVLTGLPWNAFGYALAPTPVMMQSAALVGLWGLTLAAFTIFAAPAVLVVRPAESHRGGRIFLVCVAAILLADVAFGIVRLAGAPETASGGVRLRIVQPAIPQNEKWLAINSDAIFNLELDLSENGGDSAHDGIETFDAVIWPESAFPFYLSERPDALLALADLLPNGTTLLAGASRIAPAGVFNSILAINGDGKIIDTYDKVHLVPFGEYLPFQSTLESIGISQLTGIEGGFAAGSRRRTVSLPGLPPFGPLICYEIIFPGAVTEPGNRPDWLLNVTNDAWYGDSPGPRQHFHQARLRAVEEGLPLVRAANTGISAIIDANGRIVASLDVNKVGVVDGELPAPRPPTVYSRYGDLVFWIILFAMLCAATIGILINRHIIMDINDNNLSSLKMVRNRL